MFYRIHPHLSGLVSNPDPLARPAKIGYDKVVFPAATFLVLAYSNEDRPRRYDVTDFTQNVPYPEDYFFPRISGEVAFQDTPNNLEAFASLGNDLWYIRTFGTASFISENPKQILGRVLA